MRARLDQGNRERRAGGVLAGPSAHHPEALVDHERVVRALINKALLAAADTPAHNS
ncbi:hypothetical protein [Accumulibacter sp.]|uniref:hypothetical protein n=1 Tax=Accumulibacter sp. TaxID=2053492 RepID=UPI001AD5308F|nr:hypothetical protein [Accumulibacter sp.]MBN8451552.1 hypothetical protein [Accumulibacter sp.]